MKFKADIVIAGGGPAGVIAAVAAARRGMDTVLVERYGFTGGMGTAALVLPIMTYHAGQEQVVKGIPQELIDRLVDLGGSPGHVVDPLGVASTITPVDPEYLKYVYQEMLTEAGVRLFLHSIVKDAIVESNRVRGVILQCKEGTVEIEASVVIDATGDADVAYRAGASIREGRESDGLCQPMTMMFRAGGVDVKELVSYIKQHPEQFILGVAPEQLDSLPVAGVAGFFEEVKRARERGEFPIQRDRVLLFGMPRKDEVIVNMTRVIHKRGTSSIDLSAAEVEGRRQVFIVLDFLKRHIPGFRKAYLLATGTQIGVRESRRIVGEYTLTGKDVVTGRAFHDSVARGGFPIDIHDPDGGELNLIKMEPGTSYDIPYRCLVPINREGIIVAGRSISATHDALASARISATAMALGQAAGTAAALAIQKDVSLRDVDINELQAALEQDGASWGKNQGKG